MSGLDDARDPGRGPVADGGDLGATDQALAAQLGAVLAARAGALVVADAPFDVTRPSSIDLDADDVAPGRPPAVRGAATDGVGPLGPAADQIDTVTLEPTPIAPARSDGRRWVVWVAGAVAAGVLAAALVMINSAREPSVFLDDENPSLLVGPEAAWAPTWVPDGLELWQLAVSPMRPGEATATTDPESIPPTVAQLVESRDRTTRVLLSIGGTVERYGTAATTTPVTIRGVPGRSVPVHGTVEGLQIEWEESGQPFNATVVEAEPGAAIAMLDRLELADPADPEAGFSPTDDGSVTVRTDDQRGLPETSPIGASFGYATDRPQGEVLALTVTTVGASSGSGSAAGGYPGYLMAGFVGEIRPDGTAFSFTSGSDGNPTNAQTVWPDGRVVFSSGPDLDLETAERIAAGVVPVSTAELERRTMEVSDRLGSGPVLTRADLPSGTVEVIGESEPSVLCLTVDDRRRCALGDRLSGSGGQRSDLEQVAFGSVLVDGRWFLFGADEGPVEITVELGGGGSGTTTGTGPPDPSVRQESATVGTWTVGLLVVPDSWERATIAFPNRSMNLPRPSS